MMSATLLLCGIATRCDRPSTGRELPCITSYPGIVDPYWSWLDEALCSEDDSCAKLTSNEL